jgi:quercetin 2,3-dioxygenase
VNLPAKDKMIDPRYQSLEAEDVKLLTTPDGGALIRLIAGELGDIKGPGATHTPIAVAHVTLQPGASMTLPWNPEFNALAYVLSGDGTAGTEQAPIHTGQLAVYGPGGTVTMSANTNQETRHNGLDVILLGGQPIREPIAWQGPFVMNTHAELAQAFEDFQAGRLGSIPA